MSWDQKLIDRYKGIAQVQFTSVIMNDYSLTSSKEIVLLTDTISDIYKYIHIDRFESVTIFYALDETVNLTSQHGANPTTYNSFENLAPINCKHIVIEVKSDGTVDVSTDFSMNVSTVRVNGIVYRFDKQNWNEIVYGKCTDIILAPPPGADSYFSIPTYKELETALEDYGKRVALHSSECLYLKDVWAEPKKIFFRTKPEHAMRDSLTYFLKSLRGMEARPEQNVDRSHPVDIKVTWALTHKLALIEIKWIGQSFNSAKGKVTANYTLKAATNRARKGAAQLAKYLDDNSQQTPTHVTKGYLVVFDGRREKYDTKTFNLTQQEGLKFANDEIAYDPEYHKTRDDFSKPFRFFMRPNV